MTNLKTVKTIAILDQLFVHLDAQDTFKKALHFMLRLDDNEEVQDLLDKLSDSLHDYATIERGYFKLEYVAKAERWFIMPLGERLGKAVFARKVSIFCDWLTSVSSIPREAAHHIARAGALFHAPHTEEMAQVLEHMYLCSKHSPGSRFSKREFDVKQPDGSVKRLVSVKTINSLRNCLGLIN